ncbi:autoinducer-2 kinase [Cohaesibacter celericrescens]|uniref:Autoinducer-2 kinase n=1 Tax=Cohaesibacter celericrescens TaxID=2067669 RepID=A0A2N5XLM3_9HYPH|nr:autoinducer-2 kinase [Cohaesibacter celericrescens]PLW75337.1 autoinducer-2 kinase [Cohaesibacter celericrescens]
MSDASGYVLAIDAGTGSGRAVIFDSTGHQISVDQEEWTHLSDPRFPGSMEFDCKANWALLKKCIATALKKANLSGDDIRAVSATSMREGIVIYDEDGNELWACANVDSRASEEVRALQANNPELERDAYRVSGQSFALGAIPRIKWLERHLPEVYEKMGKLSMLSDWILMRLSGEIASDPSNAGTTGIFSLEHRTWDLDIARRAGIKDTIFPPVVETGTPIGKVTAKAAADTGLKEGTLVVMGGGDVQLGALGLGVSRPGQAAVLGGTFWQEVVNMPNPVTDPNMRIRINPHVVPGVSQAEGIAFMVGMTTRWFRDAFCQEETRIAKERGIDVYALLEEMSAKVPVGANGIIPIFSDVMNMGAWYHAAPSLLNLSLDASQCGKPQIFRAIQENAAIVASENLTMAASLAGVTLDELVFAGGASKGTLWCQILADATGLPVKVPVVTEATAFAAGLAAWVGLGVYDSLPEAADAAVRWEKRIEPDATKHGLYRDIAQRWREAYAPQRDLVDRGITQSMWKAPGL